MKVLDMMVFTICLRYFNIKGMRDIYYLRPLFIYLGLP
jgi:hypothetical protein